jgi:hypothetical protein
VPSSKLRHLDGYTDQIDGITNSHYAKFELSNILETKRDKATTELMDFRVNTNYNFKSKGTHSGFSDYNLDLELYPYSWLRIESEATYSHRERYFSGARYDIGIDFGKGTSLSVGQRYARKSSNEFNYQFIWKISPKWKFSVLQRYVTGHHDPSFKRGLREQEYVLTRDLHCWTMDLNYNVTKDKGESIWLIFRLKAFPELEFEYNKSYHAPKPGSQSQ